MPTRNRQGHRDEKQGAIKRHWPTSCFAYACKQVIQWLPGTEREQKSIQMSSVLVLMHPTQMWFGRCASNVTYLTNRKGNATFTLSTLTYFVLRMVHPAIIIILIPDSSMEMSVRVRVGVALVDGVQLALAVEDTSALAGQGGHAEPAECPRQPCRFLLLKGRRPPLPSHPHSDPKTGRFLWKNVFKTKFNAEK